MVPCYKDSQAKAELGENYAIEVEEIADKPDKGEIASFNKVKLKKTETQENTLSTKEIIEQETQSDIS
ncbi:thymosin beta-10-like [Echinops telfairi]|uniref:Thymosin beta-10-like n=1 Tax=Echinops telfairi TaxID=9371 RepID=A0AC55CMT5_ECHTE|nr:thymosin beta-10-like [Echinops telfairi]